MRVPGRRPPDPAPCGDALLTRLKDTLSRIPPRRRRVIAAAVGLVVGAAGLVLAARGVDRAGLQAAFRHVDWFWIAAAAVANVVNIVGQGWAWRIGLQAGGAGPVATRHAVTATWVGKAGNQVLPGKVGEIVRIAMIRSHVAPDRREVSRIVGSLVAQRALYTLATFLVVTAAASLMPLPIDVPGGRWTPPAVLLGAVLCGAVAFRYRSPAWLRRSGRLRSGRGVRVPHKARDVARTFASGAGLLRLNRTAATALGFHVVAVCAQLAMFECLLRGFDVAAPLTAPLLIIALVGIVGAVPGAPGGVGLNQAALVAPLGAAYGIDANVALAFALGLQATLAIVAILGGAVAMLHHRRACALRAAIREALTGHPLVRRFETAAPNEGGEGVTIAVLAG